MKKVSTIFMISIALFLISCNKFLDKKADATQAVPKTLNDLQALLDYTKISNFATPGSGEASADDYFMPNELIDAYGEGALKTYIWQAYAYPYNNDWAQPYQAIYTANLCLEQLEKISRTSQNQNNWDKIKGTALFLRSYYFVQLAWVYAKSYNAGTASQDLGIIIRLTSDFNDKSKRSTVAETYAQILSDANESLRLLPERAEYQTRPSQAATYALLSRIYLSMRNYDSCMKYTDLGWKANNTLIDFNDPSVVNPNSETPIVPKNKEIIFWTQFAPFHIGTNPAVVSVDTSLFQMYDESDLRKLAFFGSNGLYYSFKGSYSGDPYVLFTGLTTAELLLTRAECYARKGMIDKALEDLNALLIKRWNAEIEFHPREASTADQALTLILEERRKELTTRGVRWMDIKRLNLEGRNISITREIKGTKYVLPPNDKRFALPIPPDIVIRTGVEQN
ncbi:RagB/SusD family nutrient uptake outer membrane protein [Pseudoflavitalea sp. G-6-1-2]|uniref:RagB/SusD family nutrient uptake outer membrane protein n=1 Tax=Pseudoflavitalea sp. G-6-1-2 TaxID=2728841 RepID=UPI00146B81E9|nr:RagB/SusD family nutrient uptake outer membrane protein [Pseudoflavitalea sp. G-6-1-2]NML23003.1 RagB/SusD family nutrient uptake outer membrane protein [Pseudoflavitalea sp. G-6-1-2]